MLTSPIATDPHALTGAPLIHWMEAGEARSALWRSERGAPPPRRVVLADDALAADTAYRLACEGTALLWRGDFQNARQLLQALARRTDKPPKSRKLQKSRQPHKPDDEPRGGAEGKATEAKASDAHSTSLMAKSGSAAEAFHLHRQAQSQRARVLGMLLLPFEADYSMPLRRAPDARRACAEAWGPPGAHTVPSVVSLRELLGVTSAHEWRKKGVEVAVLGAPPDNRIHPHYGVFSPLRGEYVALVNQARLPTPPDLARQPVFTAFDIGTGTGVLSAVLVRRGIERVVATDQDDRALTCARENLLRLGMAAQVEVVKANLFPEGTASLIVCNPPWLPARPSSPLEGAVYDEGSQMLRGFLQGLAAHLAPGGEGWLILSDIAEHLGLRSRAELLSAIEGAGLLVLGRLDAKPHHPKVSDAGDPLHAARAAEVTSLWRLAVAQPAGPVVSKP